MILFIGWLFINDVVAQTGIQNIGPSFQLPEPYGKYRVGTTTYLINDSSRTNNIPGLKGRPVFLQVWYPSSASQEKTSPYIPPGLYKAIDDENYNNIDSISLFQWTKIKTHAVPGAAPLQQQFPLIFFLHGFGISRFNYTSIIENLVSLGFIIISIDSPQSGLMVLPGGKVLTTVYDGKPDVKCENMAMDVSFVYDWMKNNPGDPKTNPLRQTIDFSRVGVAGHSLGGAAALEACRIDDRFAACADLDGDPFGRVNNEGLNKPSLILLNQPLTEAADFTEPGSKEKWEARGNERKKMWQDILNINPSTPGYVFRITATNHYSFTDFPYITREYYQQAKPGRTLDKQRSLTIITTYISAFFKRYLNEDTSVDLKTLPEKFPETNLHVTNENNPHLRVP